MTELVYAGVPPSLNAIGTRGSHWKVTRAKRQWEGICFVLLLEAQLPRRLGRVHATASLRFPTQRTRDEGNFRWMLEKALGDALVKGGSLVDDDPERFTFGEVVFESDPGPPRTIIHLTVDPHFSAMSRICSTNGE